MSSTAAAKKPSGEPIGGPATDGPATEAQADAPVESGTEKVPPPTAAPKDLTAPETPAASAAAPVEEPDAGAESAAPVSAGGSTRKGLQWVSPRVAQAKPPAGEASGNNEAADAGSGPAAEAPTAEAGNAPPNADAGDPEPTEPAPFPQVIEIEEEPESAAAEDTQEPAPVVVEDRPQETDVESGATREQPAPKADPPPVRARPPVRPLTNSQRMIRSRLRSVLSYYYRRPLNSVDHDPWEVMHHMLAYGQHSRLLDGGPRGRPMTAVGYLCYNKPCQRKQMMSLTSDGVIETRVAVGMQGHKGQLLAMLAQCDISPDYPIRVDGAELTIRDLIRSEQLSCYAGEELTFKLIGLMHYLEPGAAWVNDQGETWDFPRLIREERGQKIRGAACGGTHRLSGLALAARKRRELGQPLDGEYLEAQRFIDQYVNYAYRLQNADGSLSTEWFRGPGAEEDINRRVRTTGHLLEWLLYAAPDDKLADYRTVRAVNYLTRLLASNTQNPWEIGPLSHALHALQLYDERVFRPHDEELIASSRRRNGRPSSAANPNYRDIDSRVVRSYPSADDAEAARIEMAEASSGLRGLFGGRRRAGHRPR